MDQVRFKWLSLILLIVVAAFLQSTNFFTVFGVKPNFSLAALIAIAVAGFSLGDFLLLSLLSAVILKFRPGFDAGALVFVAAALAVFFANRHLPWTRYVNNAVLVFGATVWLYLLLSPSFLYNSWYIVLTEIGYGLILSPLILIILPRHEERLFKF